MFKDDHNCQFLLKLQTAQTEAEKDKIVDTMSKKPNLKKILNQLEGDEDDSDTSNNRFVISV